MESELGRIVDALPGLVWAAFPDGQMEFLNQRWSDYTGLGAEECRGRGWQAAVDPEDLARLLAGLRPDSGPIAPVETEARLRGADGKFRWFLFRAQPSIDASGQVVRWFGLSTDMDQRKQTREALREDQERAKALLAGEKRLLEMIAGGRPMLDVLDALCRFVESTAGGSYCSIMLLDPSGAKLQEAIAPSIAPQFNESARGWPLSRIGGPCVMAARDNVQVIMSDVGSDDRWRNSWRALAQAHGLRSCWSTPIVSQAGKVLGTFALYWNEPGSPNPLHLDLIEQFTNIASIAIERTQRDAALRQSEAQLAEAERELQLTLDTLPALVASYRPDGSRIFVNRTWLDYTGLSVERAVEAERASLAPPEDAARIEQEWRTALAAGIPFESEMRLRRADGEYRWHTVRRVPARDETGAIVRWYSVGVDIEERKRAEEALRESEYKSRLLVDSVPGLVAIFTPDGEFEFVNRQIVEYFGRTLDDLKAKRWGSRDGIHPEDLPRVTELFKQSIASGEPFEFEVRCRRFDGAYRWFQSRGYPLRDTHGRIVRWYNLLIDIDERKRTEEALRQSQARLSQAERELRLTLDTIPVMVWRGAANGYVQQLNKRWFEYTGTTPEQVRGRRWKQCVHPDDLERHVQIGTDYVAAGIPIDSEARLRRFDGEYRRFLFRPAPLRDEAGAIVGWYGTIIDIEDRKRAEEKVVEAERELQRTIDNIPVLVGTYGADGTRLSANKRALEVTGLTAEDVSDERWRQAFHPDEVAAVEEQWRACVASGEPFEREVRTRMADGTYRWHWTRRVPLRDDAGKIIRWYGVSYDIDDQKRAEQELRRSEAFLAKAQRLSLTGSFSYYSATQEFIWSEELYRIFEFEPGVRVTLELIGSRYHPEDRHVMEEVAEGIRRGAPGFDYEHRLLMADGSIKHIRVVAHGTPDKEGTGLEYFGAVQDITQSRFAETTLDKVRSELAHVTRVMSLGALTASIAHEVNQPLAGIITNASTCLRMLSADPPNVKGALETARRTIRDGNRAADVITRLRALFGKKAAATETVDLNEATREVLALVFGDLLRNRVFLRSELDDDHPLLITGDRVQLQQVILNLVRNASDAMRDVNDRPRHLLVRLEREEEGGARLLVRDAGVGIEPQNIERLFDAFYTTKSDGMGIGLSVSRSIIESHGGKLWAEANDGPGTTFLFSIPPPADGATGERTGDVVWTRKINDAHA